jgi:CheY-like chemotaxis protein
MATGQYGALDVLRVLVVDDDRLLHDDYARCLGAPIREQDSLRVARDELFGAVRARSDAAPPRFVLEHAYSGESALRAVEAGFPGGVRYCVAFVDMRMPPGWNGIDTIAALWRVDPALQIVLCTAFSDFTWDKVLASLGRSDGLHLLRKPFAGEQVRRFAEVLSKTWLLAGAHRDPSTGTHR